VRERFGHPVETPRMRVLRGRGATPAADHSLTAELLEVTAETGVPGVRVWYPPPQVAFGRRDRSESGYEAAREAAARRGYPPVQRRVGGHAVAFTGDTLAFALAAPTGAARTGIDDRYESVLGDLRAALDVCGVAATSGEPPASFCPGSHSLQAGGKIAGLAQRVRQDVSVVGGLVVARDAEAVAAVLEAVYEALDLAFDPESVGSVTDAGGDATALRDAVEDALVGDGERIVREIGEV
jgi:octanoyl-[GcvH]:protein N-octanoyltransferase